MKEVKRKDLGWVKIEMSLFEKVDDSGNVMSRFIKRSIVNNKNEVLYEEIKDTTIRTSDSFLDKFIRQVSGMNDA